MLEPRLVELYAEGRIPGHIHSGIIHRTAQEGETAPVCGVSKDMFEKQ